MATATKATKGEILNTLHLSKEDIKFIEQSPDCPNIKYCAQYLDKNYAWKYTKNFDLLSDKETVFRFISRV